MTGHSDSHSAADEADYSRLRIRTVERELRERDRELAQLREQWESWLSLLSHDARTPLTIILGYAENVLAQIPQSDADDAPSRQLQAIAAGARRLNKMISQIVDGARLDASLLTVQPRPVDPIVVMTTELRRARQTYPEQTFCLDLPSTMPRIVADPRRLAQIISSFLSNAASYSPPGSEIRISARRREKHVVISVSDPGRGLATEELTQVFETGFQSDRPPEGRREGLGISLAMAKRSAEVLGGEIWASSPGPDLGATFHLALPATNVDVSDENLARPTRRP